MIQHLQALASTPFTDVSLCSFSFMLERFATPTVQ